jgi:predicted Zn finger-like uncharacterized protein
MSLVTRCPACTTTFKVVRDQLRISDGWVRCGRCSHVFDATLDLHEAPDGAPGDRLAATGAGRLHAGTGRAVRGAEDARAGACTRRAVGPAIAARRSAWGRPDGNPGRCAASSTEDADFFDDEPEPQTHEASAASSVPEPAPPPPSPPPRAGTLRLLRSPCPSTA